MSLLDHPIIGQRYFFPIQRPLPDAVRVSTPAGSLACWRSGPPSERPVLVHFHGNGELVHDWIPLLGPFAQSLGFEAFLAEYRGYGGSEGEPALGAMLDDVPRIADVVGVDPSRVVVFGRSVGSIYAMEWIDRFPSTAGMVLESGIHDVLERLVLRIRPEELGVDLAGLRAAVAARLDHRAKLQGYPGPSLILHATGDHLVSIAHARANANAALDAWLVEFDQGDHNSILARNQAAYLQELGEFLVQRHPEPIPTDTLNRLVILPHHRSHQRVLKELQGRADPSTVAWVARRLEMGFADLEYTASEDGVIAKWCSWALFEVGTAEARAVAERFAQGEGEVADEMRYRLGKWVS